jgi:hypothetical protein
MSCVRLIKLDIIQLRLPVICSKTNPHTNLYSCLLSCLLSSGIRGKEEEKWKIGRDIREDHELIFHEQL